VARYFFHHFLGAEDIAWLAQFKDLHLSEDEAKALIVVREAGALNNGTYRELTKVDTLTASQALRRLRDVVRQNYLRPLMREGRLTMTNPQEPNDPQQAYRAM